MSGVQVNNGVVNYGGLPSGGSGLLAARPAAGVVGRIYIASDSLLLYRDTGSSWATIGGGGGGITGSGATGQATFWTGASAISGDNTFFWDNINKRLGLGTITPGARLDIHSQGTIIQINGTGTGNTYIDFQNAGSTLWRLGNTYNGGTRLFQIIDVNTSTQVFSIASNGVIGIYNGAPTLFGNGGLVIGNQGAGNGKSLVINSSSDGNNGLLQFIDQSANNSLQVFGTTTQVGFFGYGTRSFDIATNSTIRFSISGIGNATAVNRLNVFNATDNALYELNVNGNTYTGGLSPTILTVGTNTTMARTATGYYCTASITLTLPSAASLNNVYWIIAASGVTVTVNRAGSDDILNLTGASVTTISITSNQRAMFYVGGGTRTYLISQA